MVGAITNRNITFGSVVTLVHYIPIVHTPVAALVCYIVYIVQPQAVRELVAYKTYSGKHPAHFGFVFFIVHKLAAAGIGIALYTIYVYCRCSVGKRPLVWPNSIVCRTIGFRITGIYAIDKFHFTVAIVVAFGEIETCRRGF